MAKYGTITSSGVAIASNIKRGAGSPNGSVSGSVGDIYQRTDGSGQTYSCQGGTAWVDLSVSAGSPTLSQVLTTGNTAGGTDIILDSGANLIGTDGTLGVGFTVRAGAGTTGAGGLLFVSGGDSGSGAGGNLILSAGTGSPSGDVFVLGAQCVFNVGSGTALTIDTSSRAHFENNMAVGGVAPNSYRLNVSTTDVPVAIFETSSSSLSNVTIANTSSSFGAGMQLVLRSESASLGDPYLQFDIVGGATWSVGPDNSGSDEFVISNGASLGNDKVLQISDTTQNVTWNAGSTFEVDTVASNALLIDSSQNTFLRGQLFVEGAYAQISGAAATDGSSYPTVEIRNTLNTSGWTINQPWASLDFYSEDTSGFGPGVRAAIRAVNKSDTQTQVGLKFFVSNTGSFVEAMDISANGDIQARRNLIVEGQLLSELVTTADAASIVTNLDEGNVHQITLGGNRTLAVPSNPIPGSRYTWIFRQDGTGNRTLAFNSIFHFPDGIAPVLSTAPNAVDKMECVYDGSAYLCTVALNLS